MATKKKVKVKKPRTTDFSVAGNTPATLPKAAMPTNGEPLSANNTWDGIERGVLGRATQRARANEAQAASVSPVSVMSGTAYSNAVDPVPTFESIEQADASPSTSEFRRTTRASRPATRKKAKAKKK